MYVGRSGQANAVRQHASDGHYVHTVHSGINTGLDMASIADGACGVPGRPALPSSMPVLLA